jgi:hypothetical protein
MMKKYLTILCLAFLPLIVFSESEKLELTEEQLADMEAAEEKYKDDPGTVKFIKQMKERLGIVDDPVSGEPPPPSPPKHITTTEGSMDGANAAYARGDYKTALEQYKVMAAQGNPEANTYVGMMYEAGMGTEADTATANAWYKRAAESDPDDPRYSRLVNEQTLKDYEKSRMSAEDVANADVINEEINSEIDKVSGKDQSEYQAVEYSDAETRSIATDGYSNSGYQIDDDIDHSIPMQAKTRYMRKQQPGIILFKPEKLDQPHYLRLESHTDHHHPEKFIREPELNTIEKS